MFRKLSLRTHGAPSPGPIEGIHASWHTGIASWIQQVICRDDGFNFYSDTSAIVRRLNDLQVDLQLNPPLNWSQREESAFDSLITRAISDDEFCLDVLDYLLAKQAYRSEAEALADLLHRGNSAWEVDLRDDNMAALRKRGTPPTSAILSGLGTGSDARAYLEDAWSALTHRHPDPGRAFTQSQLAVEAAYRPVVAPKSESQTIGMLAGDIKAKPSKWSTALANVPPEQVAGLMSGILGSHEGRHHHKERGRVEVSLEAAYSAFYLCVALVGIVDSGGFQKS